MTVDETADYKNLCSKIKRVYRLKDVIRYNTRKVIKHESVAEHCFNVAVITLALCDKAGLSEKEKCAALIKALLHDMPEMDYNDITHDVKTKLNLQPLLKQYEDDFYKKEFPEYYDLMSKGDELVNTIVEYADVLSVMQYIKNEKEIGNCSTDIDEIMSSTVVRLKEIKEKMKCILEERNGTLA